MEKDLLEYTIAPDTEVVMTRDDSRESNLTRALKKTGDIVVIGTYYAPTFILEERENHGMGYHCHIRMRRGGGYERAGYLVTMTCSQIFVTRHGGDALFDINKVKHALEKDIHVCATNYLGKIPQGALLPTTSESIRLE